jgi:hypothetical protein
MFPPLRQRYARYGWGENKTSGATSHNVRKYLQRGVGSLQSPCLLLTSLPSDIGRADLRNLPKIVINQHPALVPVNICQGL